MCAPKVLPRLLCSSRCASTRVMFDPPTQRMRLSRPTDTPPHRQRLARLQPVSNRTGTSSRICRPHCPRGCGTAPNGHSLTKQLLLHSGYRSMNTKLALSAVVAALMLTACAKQESAGTDQAATPPPAPAAPAADQAAGAAADAKAAADSAAQSEAAKEGTAP